MGITHKFLYYIFFSNIRWLCDYFSGLREIHINTEVGDENSSEIKENKDNEDDLPIDPELDRSVFLKNSFFIADLLYPPQRS
jgi:hypothetical protein